MKRRLGSLVTAVVIAIVGSGTWWFFHESRATSQDESATADKAKSESMRRRGSESAQILHADVTSLISKLAVQEGAIVAAGNPLIELVAQNRLEARLGVEAEDSDKVNPGQEVSLARVNAPGTKSIVGRIRKISRAADATTR